VLTVAASAIATLAAPEARAEAGSTKAFSVPLTCGNESAFVREIRARVGKDAELLLQSLQLSIEATGDGFALSMRVGDEAKHLVDPHCDDLFRAAVVIAVALWEAPRAPEPAATDLPSTSTEPRAAEGASAPNEATPSEATTVSPPPGPHDAPEPNRVRAPLHASLQGEAGVVSGLTPDGAPTFGLRGTLEGPRVGVATGLRLLWPNEDRDDQGRGVSIFAVGAHVSGLVRPVPRLSLELGASAYLLRGRGLGSHATDTAILGSFGPRLGLWVIPYQTPRVSVSLGAEGQLAVLRPTFEISDYGRVFRAAAGNVGGFLAVGYRIF
jgi:hypothetical protein